MTRGADDLLAGPSSDPDTDWRPTSVLRPDWHDACDRHIALLETQLAETAIANAELRTALNELYEPNHRKHPNAKRCDVCGMRWPCAHYDAALLIHGDRVG